MRDDLRQAVRFLWRRRSVTALAVATIVSTVLSYVLNREWSFRTRGGRERHHEAALFFIISGVGVAVYTAPLAISRYLFDLQVPDVSLFTQELADFGARVVADEQLRRRLDAWGSDLVVWAVDRYSGMVIKFSPDGSQILMLLGRKPENINVTIVVIISPLGIHALFGIESDCRLCSVREGAIAVVHVEAISSEIHCCVEIIVTVVVRIPVAEVQHPTAGS